MDVALFYECFPSSAPDIPCPLCVEFLPQGAGLPLLAGSVPPLHVADGEPAEDAALQLHQRGPGLRGRSSGAHPTGASSHSDPIEQVLDGFSQDVVL